MHRVGTNMGTVRIREVPMPRLARGYPRVRGNGRWKSTAFCSFPVRLIANNVLRRGRGNDPILGFDLHEAYATCQTLCFRGFGE